uniref:Heat shock 70 kDa protein 12A n=1 Tax=Neogobius melanostomus TaxID=47308 RepID=A0A8C6UPV9_9GOBI
MSGVLWRRVSDLSLLFGYAYSLTPRNKDVSPHVRRWGQEQGHDTPKTPSCILLDHHGTFLYFGYEAKCKYLEMHKDEANNYYYFENFKMELYDKVITKDLEIKDVNKKSMSALRVFSAALNFLKEDALNTILFNTNGVKFKVTDFTWVLTVPAIWDNSARQFMREAAEQAGIKTSGNKLLIALEPEAASIWSKNLQPDDFISKHHDRAALQQFPGTQYIVVDCGGQFPSENQIFNQSLLIRTMMVCVSGGTIDITVHEVLEGGVLKELHKASGNDKGGRTVDRKFRQALRELFCDGLWETYERDHPSEAQKFMYDFETVKLRITENAANMTSYCNLGRLVHERQSKDREVFNVVEGMSWHSGKILISRDKMESFFYGSLVHITDSLIEILDKHPDISYILLVGGFAQSTILRERVQKEFSDQAQVLCPINPQEVILKGAVMFGRDPSLIRSRKSAFTYGVAKSNIFDPSVHKEEKRLTTKDGVWCTDLFSKLVGIGDDVEWNQTKEYIFCPLERDWKSMKLSFYRTERKNVTYVDDWGVEGPVASCVMDMPDISKGMNRVKLEVFFGATEIKAKATDLESKNTATVNMDFISKQ